MAGRPTKLTPEVQERICKALAAGNTKVNAARLAGIAYSSFKLWMQRGNREGETAFSAFSASVKKAEAEAEDEKLSRITAAHTPHDDRVVKEKWKWRDGEGGGKLVCVCRDVTIKEGVYEWQAAA